MFVHRSPFPRNYHYSHPLAGTQFNNNLFITNATPRDDQSTNQSEQGFRDKVPSKYATTQEFHTKEKIKARGLQSEGQRRVKPSKKNSMIGSRGDTGNKSWYGPIDSLLVAKDATMRVLQTAPEGKRLRRGSQHRRLKRKLAINPFVDSYLFPTIQLHIIHKISSVEQIPKFSFNYSFQKIFKKLISTQLMGEYTSNFMLKMEHYIRRIIQNDELYINPLGIVMQNSHKAISRKNDLLDVVYDLEGQGEQDRIEELVKYYCIPGEKEAAKIFNEMMYELVIEMFETRNCRKDMQYCLLTTEGQHIGHISEIFFTTRQLYICPEHHHQQFFHKYSKILQDHDKQQRMTFKESVRHNFVSRIVRDKIDNKLVNYNKNPREAEEYRRESYQQAQELLNNRSKTRLHRCGKVQDNERELSPRELSFTTPTFSKQTLYYSYMQRKFRQKKEYSDFIKRLQKVLDPRNKYSLKTVIDRQVEEEFIQLQVQNDLYEHNYSQNPDNAQSVLISNLIQNHAIFRGKRDNQIKALISTLAKIYNKGHPMKELTFGQFKQMLETAHGVADKNITMKYVLSYLPFDEYGQISRKDMDRVLSMAMGVEGRTVKMVGRIVWNWLERSKLVENGALRKRNIQIWYEPVKVVYLLMLSVMFGGEYGSLEEMFSDMLKYDYH